jgi:hypothetical protein
MLGNLIGRNSEDIIVNETIILEWGLKKYDGRG